MGEGRGYSRGCKFACCCCSCVCCLLVSLAIVLGVVAATLKVPQVEARNVVIKTLAFTPPDTLTLNMDVGIWIKNDNVRPLGGTIKTLWADVFSLDKGAADKVGVPYYLGNTTLPSEVRVDPKSETTFTLNVNALVQGATAVPVITRLRSDCGSLPAVLATKGTTRIRAAITALRVNVWRMDWSLPEIDIDTNVECSPL